MSLALSIATAACATGEPAGDYFPEAGGHGGDALTEVAGMSAAAGSGGTGLGGGNLAGQAAPAGAGGASGSAAEAGGAGAGGSAGAAGSLAGAGGSSSSGAKLAAAGGGGSAGTCPSSYTTATHFVLNVSWPSSIGVKAGTDIVHIWTKSKNVASGSQTTTESMTCGTSIPDVPASDFAGGFRILPEIPNSAWASASMPKFTGTATKNGSSFTMDAGISLIGLTMSNPSATWPAFGSITSADHDGDGKPGVTAVMKETMGYGLPPVSISNNRLADQLYFATRNAMTLSATFDGCPQTFTGTVKVSKFENHVVGCHVKGSGDCSTKEASFLDDNRTIYKVESATFTTKVVTDNASCEQVRVALP